MKTFRTYADDHALHDYGRLSYSDCLDDEKQQIRNDYNSYERREYQREIQAQLEEQMMYEARMEELRRENYDFEYGDYNY